MTGLLVHFDGTPPEVAPGDQVEIRTAGGMWLQATARSEPRYDRPNAIGRKCYLTVSVDTPNWDHPVNWPAEDVRKP